MDLPEEKYKDYDARVVKTGLGWECLGRNKRSLDRITVNWAVSRGKVLARSLDRRNVCCVDLGGASGVRAHELAEVTGFNVVVVDLGDERETINERNKRLSENRAYGQLGFAAYDLRKMDEEKLLSCCFGATPVIFTAYNLLHMLEFSEAKALFKAVSRVAAKDAVFGVSYDVKNPSWNDHDPKKILALAKACGFELAYKRFIPVTKGEDGVRLHKHAGKMGQGFRLRHLPKNACSSL